MVQHSGVLLECGKIFKLAGDDKAAEASWERGLDVAKNDPSQVEVYSHLLANLADLKLGSGVESVEADGIKMLDAAADTKFLSGDLHGLANSYSMRGLYHWRKGQFEPAIAFLRKDLALSRQVGDQTGLAQTLANLAGLYGQMRQPKAARRVLEEARKIAATLKNPSLDGFVSNQTARLEKNTREMAKTGESFGPAAPCQCGSGKNYRDCCGRADFEPVGLPWNFGGLSQDIEQATTAQTDLGIKPTRLDWFLADWDQTKDRLSWFKVFPRPGWHEIHELPDMASIQLSAAREAAKTAKENPASYEWPLSALVMSVCALEAFINQVAFFLKEANVEAVGLGPLPFTSGPFAFQRSTELSKKWDILGRFLCPSTWRCRLAGMNS